jgi:hypothetical protein
MGTAPLDGLADFGQYIVCLGQLCARRRGAADCGERRQAAGIVGAPAVKREAEEDWGRR